MSNRNSIQDPDQPSTSSPSLLSSSLGTNLSGMSTPIVSLTTRTSSMMPTCRAKEAPSKFTGKPSKVKRFLQQYQDLCTSYNVTTDQDKCKHILEYCSDEVGELVRALKSYNDNNWRELEADFNRYFDSELEEAKHNIQELNKLVKEWRRRSI